MGIARQFQKLDALFHVGFLGILVPFDGLQANKLFCAPLVRHLVEERRVDQAIELVDIHGVDPLLQPLVFGLVALDRLFVFPALVSVAGMKRITHPFEHVVIEAEPPEQVGELRLERLFAHMLFAANRGRALALIGPARAMVVDVSFLLDLGHYRAAARAAGDQTREGEVAMPLPELLGETPIHDSLDTLP